LKVRIISDSSISLLGAILPFCFPVSAADLDSSLVVHWNFEGTTEAEVFADKSSGGSVNDALTVDKDTTYITPFTSVSEICSWNNGTITNDIAAKHPILAAHSDDIHTLTSRATTLMLRFKLNTLSGETFLTNMCTQNNGINSGFSLFVSSAGKLYAQNYWNSGSGNTTYDLSVDGAVGVGEWINLAITIGERENSTDGLMSAYYSYGLPQSPAAWITGCTNTRINVSNTGITTNDFALFARPIDTGNHGNGITTFDDIRLYNKILTQNEIAEVYLSGSFYGSEEIKTPSDSLVLHYDFEGNDIATALKDKAGSASAVADDLVFASGDIYGLAFDLENGSVKAYDAGNGLKAEASADTAAVAGKASTVFIRAKMELSMSDASNVYYFMDMNSTKGRPYSFFYQSANDRFALHTAERRDIVGTRNNAFFDYAYDMLSDEYMNIALVSERLIDGTFRVAMYMSLGEPEDISDWTVVVSRSVMKNDAPIATEPLTLLNSMALNGADGVVLDDVRLYNRALSLKQVSEMFTEGSFDMGNKNDDAAHLIKGVQYANPDGNTYNVRFIGGIDDLEKYDSVGYEVVLFNGEEAVKADVKSNFAYLSVNQNIGGRINSITAEELGVKYITAVAITDIPETCEKYIITPYVIVDGNKIYSPKVAIDRHHTWNK